MSYNKILLFSFVTTMLIIILMTKLISASVAYEGRMKCRSEAMHSDRSIAEIVELCQ